MAAFYSNPVETFTWVNMPVSTQTPEVTSGNLLPIAHPFINTWNQLECSDECNRAQRRKKDKESRRKIKVKAKRF